MTTQSLRGLVFQGAEHWRGDRQSNGVPINETDSTLAFEAFNVAFDGLVGRDEPDLGGADDGLPQVRDGARLPAQSDAAAQQRARAPATRRTARQLFTGPVPPTPSPTATAATR